MLVKLIIESERWLRRFALVKLTPQSAIFLCLIFVVEV